MGRKKLEIDELSSSGASFTNKLEQIAFPTIFFFSQIFPNAANPHSLIFESPFSHHKNKQKQKNKTKRSKSIKLRMKKGKIEAILRRGVAKRDETDDSDSNSTSTRHM
jgi:hypothetical protein